MGSPLVFRTNAVSGAAELPALCGVRLGFERPEPCALERGHTGTHRTARPFADEAVVAFPLVESERGVRYVPVKPRDPNVSVEKVERVRSTAGWSSELLEHIAAGNEVVWAP